MYASVDLDVSHIVLCIYHNYMFNMCKVSLDAIKYWLLEPYATPSGVVGKVLRLAIYAYST